MRARGAVSVPPVEPNRTGIVHLGIGAFHRAHQATFTEDAAAAAGEQHWGICGVTQRSNTVLDQLRPQGGLYTVLERSDGHPRGRVVRAVREVLSGVDEADAVAARIADDDVQVVTLTVTEKGYRRRPDGRLDLDDPAVQADVAGFNGGRPQTAVGQLVRGLHRRRATSGAPLTVLPCDNLIAGGAVLRQLVLDFCAAGSDGDDLTEWISANVSFPSAVVDRIVPATQPADRAEATRLLGVDDAGVVVTEPFRQWIIEDHFAAARPPWERAGVVFTDDVAPYEKIKLRLLNATHSLLAYTGALAGYETIAEAVGDPELAEAAERLMRDDAAPTLVVPSSFDTAGYRTQVLERFANPALRHRTTQVAGDGSQKLPLRLLGTIRDRLAAGAQPTWAALAVAAWMVLVGRGTDQKGRPLPLDDPLADRLRAAVGAADQPDTLVSRLLAVQEVFGPDLADDPHLQPLLIEHVTRLWR